MENVTHPKSDAGAVALLSGGVDSAVMTGMSFRGGDTVWPLYLRQGFLWEDDEIRAVGQYLDSLKSANGANGANGSRHGMGGRLKALATCTLGVAEGYKARWATAADEEVPDENSPDEAVFLPGRNLALLTQAAIYAHTVGAGRIQLGTLKGNPFPDATETFFRSFERTAAEAMNLEVSIETPLAKLSKTDVLLRGKDFDLGLTLSCIRPSDGKHCGRCNKCEERRRAFENAGLSDAAPYLH